MENQANTLDNILMRLKEQSYELLIMGAKILALAAGAYVAWRLFKYFFNKFEVKVQEQTFFAKNPYLLPLIRKAGGYVILISTLGIMVQLLKAPVVDRIFYAATILILAGPVKEVVVKLAEFMEERVAVLTESKMDDVVFSLINRFAGFLIYALAVILALDVLGVNVMPFVAGAGVVGIAVGFAAKDTLSNLIAGVLLLIDRPFQVGDRIEVWSAPKNSATWGDIIDIGIRATKIRTTDNIIVVIPNNEIMRRDIVNYTTLSEDIRVRIPIGVSYTANLKKAKNLCLEVANGFEWAIKEGRKAPAVVVRSFGESSVDLELRIWIKDARKRMDAISYVTDNIKEVFDREGIEIPYPKRDVYMHVVPGESEREEDEAAQAQSAVNPRSPKDRP